DQCNAERLTSAASSDEADRVADEIVTRSSHDVTGDESPPSLDRVARPRTAARNVKQQAGQREARVQYVDAVRVWAIALVFVVHVAEVFNPWDEWHIQNGERSRVIGELALIPAPWVMPIIMLLAGVSAWYSLHRRDNKAYLRDRVVRVLLPL